MLWRGQVGTYPLCSGRCRPLRPFLQEARASSGGARAALSSETEGGEGLAPARLAWSPCPCGGAAPLPAAPAARGLSPGAGLRLLQWREAEPSWDQCHLWSPAAAPPSPVPQAVLGDMGPGVRQGSSLLLSRMQPWSCTPHPSPRAGAGAEGPTAEKGPVVRTSRAGPARGPFTWPSVYFSAAGKSSAHGRAGVGTGMLAKLPGPSLILSRALQGSPPGASALRGLGGDPGKPGPDLPLFPAPGPHEHAHLQRGHDRPLHVHTDGPHPHGAGDQAGPR